MPRVQLNDVTIHFQQIGRGPDIVLIHGLFCNLAFWWFAAAPRLAEHHRVTALDLRGHGFSGMPPRGYRAVDLAGDVVRLLDHLGIIQAHVIGHSFGGAVAAALAARAPERVARLTLADAWIPSLQPEPPLGDPPARLQAMAEAVSDEDAELPRVIRGFLTEVAALAPATAAASGLAELLPAPGARPSPALRKWRLLVRGTQAVREFRDREALCAASFGTIRAPVDLIYGENSRFHDSRRGVAALAPWARSVIVPNAGHFFPLLQTDAFLAGLRHAAAIPATPAPARRTNLAS